MQENPRCEYCGSEMTLEEIEAIAEAEDLTVAQVLAEPRELMCDKCANSDGEEEMLSVS